MQTKNPGAAVLLVSVILSGLILTIGLGLARLLSTELQFSSDLMLGERAYFAAESGVETALWALQNEPDNSQQDPVNWVADDENGVHHRSVISNGVSYFALKIGSRELFFEETLLPRHPLKLLLRRDNRPDLQTTLAPVLTLKISLPENQPNSQLDWKILCPGNAGTVALQSTELCAADSLESFSQMTGTSDDGVSTETMDAFDFLQQQNDTGCYLTITNFDDEPTRLRFETTNGMAPAAPRVTARGVAGSREKVVSFRYRQKNLSELFGFGLFHED